MDSQTLDPTLAAPGTAETPELRPVAHLRAKAAALLLFTLALVLGSALYLLYAHLQTQEEMATLHRVITTCHEPWRFRHWIDQTN